MTCDNGADCATVTVRHEVHRLTISTGLPYGEMVRRYEEAVPALDGTLFDDLRARRASWEAIREATVPNAPHDFIRYWTADFTWMMRAAGDRGDCTEYLMGNHLIAERMFRHDPGVLLHAPLRTTIHTGRRGETRFSLDQPSTLFRSFDDPDITAVGVELDRKVAALLDVLDVPVPEALAAGHVPTG
jgi:hypothetical protein